MFPLPPEIARVVLGGGSLIDQPRVHHSSLPRARDFALNYGYDVDVPNQRSQLVKVFEDALSFMEDVILEGTGLDLPAEFCDLQDPLELLVWASERPMGSRARWSCALLRVMHTLIHLDNNVYLRFLPEIQQQIKEHQESLGNKVVIAPPKAVEEQPTTEPKAPDVAPTPPPSNPPH